MIHCNRFVMINIFVHLRWVFVWLICLSAWWNLYAQQPITVISPDSVQQDSSFLAPDSVSAMRQFRPVSVDSSLQPKTLAIWRMIRPVMNEYFYEDLGDILNYFPGVYLNDRGSTGQKLSITRHGANERQTRLLFNGNPLYDPIMGGLDLNLIPTGMIDEISVGTDWPIGWRNDGSETVAIQPLSYHEDLSYSRVGYHKAPYGFSDVDVIFASRASRKLTLILGRIIKSYDGKTDTYRFEQQNLRGRIVYQLARRWSMDYYWISNKIKRSVPNPSFASNAWDYPLISAKENISRIDHGLTVSGRLFRALEPNLKANFFYSGDRQAFSDKNFNFQFTDRGRYAGGNIGFQHRLGAHRTYAGGELIHEWTDADQVADQRHTAGSVFLQDEWRLRRNMELNILGNYQFHNKFGNRLTGAIGTSVWSSPNCRLNLIARQSIRYPVFFETSARTNFIGNPELRPEWFQTIEFGGEWELPARLLLKGTAYYKYADQIIRLAPLDSLRATFMNQGNTHSSGLDLLVQWTPSRKWQWTMLFSYLEMARQDGTPKIWLITHAQYSDSFFQGDLKPSIRLEMRYVGPRTSQVVHPYLFRIDRDRLDPVLVLNAQVLFNFGNLKVFFLLENLLDRKYQLLYGNDMNRRTLHYGLRWEFWD